MKRMKAIVLFGCIALAAVITFAGCATGGGATGGAASPDTATADTGAKKLAADINAIKPDSAKVNGDTVTVSGWVGLKKRLTVPEGVTLDLTAEGTALELQDGAALTVNGTVNAAGHGDHGSGWVEGSLRVGDGAALIDGTGTIRLASKGRLFNIGGDRGRRQLTLDGVTLVGLSDNDHSLVGINENGELVLKSGAITGNTRSDDDWASGGGVEVWHGTFTMEDGEISGNSASGKTGSSGGGVSIGEESVFTMKGGTIRGNSANGKERGDGGGVYVGEGTFMMEGGAISGNSANGGQYGSGGGVVVNGNATFTIRDGTISGNTAVGIENNGNGGGVRVGGKGTFIMQGGVISANTASSVKRSGTGGGVDIASSKASSYGQAVFIMEGGTIYGKAESLPAGTDASLANSASHNVTLRKWQAAVKWGMGGVYTKGGVPQTGGSDIVPLSPGSDVGSTDDTLIAIPAK